MEQSQSQHLKVVLQRTLFQQMNDLFTCITKILIIFVK